MTENLDLLGDPIPENWGKRGRPSHIPTQENRIKVRLLLARGWTDRRIAQALRITKATLKKHYFVELRHRDEARPALEAQAIKAVYDSAMGGNVGAMRELIKMLDKDDLVRTPADLAGGKSDTAKLGKKELKRRAALNPDTTTPIGELMARRAGGETIQ